MLDLRCGDCLDVLKDLADDSIDAIVTDPPYGLGFMGKHWDHGVPSGEVWRQCLRVLKPGGHLLAFAGTRTQHRMAVNIEDAGFEIRDMIAWVYGQGFPKSLNVGNSFCGCYNDGVDQSGKPNEQRAEKIPEHPVRPLRRGDISQAERTGEEQGQVLQQSVQEQGAPTPGRKKFRPTQDGERQPIMEGWSYAVQKEGQLYGRDLCQSAGVGEADGSERRIHNGASSGDGSDVRSPDEQKRGCESQGPQPQQQRPQQLGNVSVQRKSQEGRVGENCRGCGKPITAKDYKGFGTALKPALEPITVARKPFSGTVAANVLAHGTGAMNVDGCRVASQQGESFARPVNHTGLHEGWDRPWKHNPDALAKERIKRDEMERKAQDLGRWPANLIHDGSDEVVGLFPVTGASKAAARGGTNPNPMDWGNGRTDGNIVKGHDDNGGSAARFFKECRPDVPETDFGNMARFMYCAKASKKDRDEGLDGTCTVKYTVDKSTIGDLSCRDVSTELVELLRKVTSGLTLKWAIGECGVSITGQCPTDSLSTTLTTISKITPSKILSLLTPLPTSEFTAGANYATENGGSPAVNAGSSSKSRPISTSGSQAESVRGVSLAVSQMLLRISDGANWKPTNNIHSTVKPTALMRYLCRLVTPPGGVVLDPFMGSGSTGKAALLEGFSFVGIEREAEYMEIAQARIKGAQGQRDLFAAA